MTFLLRNHPVASEEVALLSVFPERVDLAHQLPILQQAIKVRWPSGLRRCVQVRFELVTIRSLERGLGSNPSLISFLFLFAHFE
jgi:hypothetical protein